jgi:glycosyltransferase involved in cell wall biosynthesis
MVLDVAPTLPVAVEVLMVDDGSTDNTRAFMQQLCDKYEACRMIANQRNVGVGRSVLNAYDYLEPNSWAMVIPGDNEFVFDSITNYLAVREQYDVILGYCQNLMIRSLSRRIASAAYAHVVNLVYGYSYRYHNGMKMYRVRALRGLAVEANGYAFFAELLAKALLRDPTLRVGEVPFIARGRSSGVSKAFRPLAMVRAIYEVYRGSKSVSRYREEVIGKMSVRAGENRNR